MSNANNGKKDRDSKEDVNINIDLGFGKLFGGLKNIVDVISDLTDGEIKKEGTVSDPSGKVKGVYGFSIRTMADRTTVESFGNKIRENENGGMVIDEVREPVTDVFDEGDFYTIVMEIPGVDKKDIAVDVKGDIVKINAKSGNRIYEKEVFLKSRVSEEIQKKNYTNGIFELEVKKSDS